MASTIQVRVDDELKDKADQLFKDLGTDTTSAVRMFLIQAVAQNGFPFEIKRVKTTHFSGMTEEELLENWKGQESRLLREISVGGFCDFGYKENVWFMKW